MDASFVRKFVPRASGKKSDNWLSLTEMAHPIQPRMRYAFMRRMMVYSSNTLIFVRHIYLVYTLACDPYWRSP
jgi:hypothetical protein